MGKEANPFVNRIIGYTTKRASQLTANPSNWRKHPQRQRDAVQASLRELGWIGAVVENVRTGFLVDGHERVWQAMKNDEEVPVLQVDLSEEEERLALAVFDPITYMAETDTTLLDELLGSVNTGEAALQELIAQMDAENELTTLQGVGNGESNERGLSTKGKVAPVLFVDQVATFEQAIRSTGLRNRGMALIAICEFYLDNAEKRQLDALFENITAA